MSRKLLFGACLLLSVLSSKAQPGFTRAGSAIYTYDYNLTPLPGNYQAGAMWADGTNSAIPMAFDFTRDFYVQFFAKETNQPVGADGFCIVFGANITLTSLNNNAAFLGYYDNCPGSGPLNPDFTQSLAIEFDIFNNSATPCFFDPSPYYDHAVLVRDASFMPLAGPVQISPASPTIKDGRIHQYVVTWDATTQLFSLSVDGASRFASPLTGVNSPAAIFGTSVNNVKWGFTGGTGGSNSDQEIIQISCGMSRRDANPATSVQNVTNEQLKLVMSPNPTMGAFTLSGGISDKDATSMQVEVFDVTGRIVYQSNVMVDQGMVKSAIQLNDKLANGLYILKAHTASESQQMEFTLDR